MKHLFLTSFSILALNLLATPAFASEFVAKTTSPSNRVQAITPFNLVSRAYQGAWFNQGIPSNAALNLAVASGKVDASALVKAAIAQGRLSPETLNDTVYLNAVDTYLEGLDKG